MTQLNPEYADLMPSAPAPRAALLHTRHAKRFARFAREECIEHGSMVTEIEIEASHALSHLDAWTKRAAGVPHLYVVVLGPCHHLDDFEAIRPALDHLTALALNGATVLVARWSRMDASNNAVACAAYEYLLKQTQDVASNRVNALMAGAGGAVGDLILTTFHGEHGLRLCVQNVLNDVGLPRVAGVIDPAFTALSITGCISESMRDDLFYRFTSALAQESVNLVDFHASTFASQATIRFTGIFESGVSQQHAQFTVEKLQRECRSGDIKVFRGPSGREHVRLRQLEAGGDRLFKIRDVKSRRGRLAQVLLALLNNRAVAEFATVVPNRMRHWTESSPMQDVKLGVNVHHLTIAERRAIYAVVHKEYSPARIKLELDRSRLVQEEREVLEGYGWI
jgi:hypothetical protein